MVGLELSETHSTIQCVERQLLQDDLTLLDLPGGEQSSSLARRLPDDEGWTGGLVGLPVLDLALLAAVGSFPTDTAFQLLSRILLAEITGAHLLSKNSKINIDTNV